MGIFSSRGSVTTDPLHLSLADDSATADVLKDFDTSPPTAAVIGAGIAGVHVAYELAQLGFRVTVYDQRSAVALGETQYTIPFVGIGLLQPYIYKLRMGREILRGTVAFTCPDVIFAEDAWNSFFSVAIHRWLWARHWNTLSKEQVMRYTNNLSRLSVGVVEDFCKKHQSLAPYLLSRNVSTAIFTPTQNSGSGEVTTQITAHPKPLMIDPVGWTRELAKICRDVYGVKFAFGEKLLDITTYLRYNVEMVSTLRFSRDNDGHTEYKNCSYDVVVLTAGSQTGQLTWASSQLPIIGLSGCSVALPTSSSLLSNAAFAPLKRLLFATPLPSFVSLSPSSQLVAYKTFGNNSANSNSSGGGGDVDGSNTEGFLVLLGLLSFDSTTRAGSVVGKALKRLEKYIYVKCGFGIPLLREFQKEQRDVGIDAGNANAKSNMRVARYIRAFTPDGVPLIANNGAAFNSFVCAGFGDHAADMAPGAAKVLAKLIEKEACAMQHHNEEEMSRQGESFINPIKTKARLDHVNREWQLLLNGCFAVTDIQSGQKMEFFAQNPFSSARFNGVVKETVYDVSHISLWRRFLEFETKLVRACEPWGHYVNQQAIKLARRDNMPDWLRTIVFYYFNDEEDDEEMLRNKQQYVEGIRRIRKKFEEKSHESSSSFASLSPREAK